MASLFDRVNAELESLGRMAQGALDEGRLRVELFRLRQLQDGAARDLGLLTHRQHRGEPVETERIARLHERLEELARDIDAVERQIAAARAETVSVHDVPRAGAPATPDVQPASPDAPPPAP